MLSARTFPREDRQRGDPQLPPLDNLPDFGGTALLEPIDVGQRNSSACDSFSRTLTEDGGRALFRHAHEGPDFLLRGDRN
ncbi:hypothetical protein CYK37_23755 [Mesorhizobium loti]|nr:hypothetical protein CYK37_23755 [Mesorhizobium loti]